MVVCLVRHNQTLLVSSRMILEDTVVCEMTALECVDCLAFSGNGDSSCSLDRSCMCFS